MLYVCKKKQLFRQINNEIPKKEKRKSKKYMEISMFYYVICVCMLHVWFFFLKWKNVGLKKGFCAKQNKLFNELIKGLAE